MRIPSGSVTIKHVFIIADTINRVVFISQGYTIGLGECIVGIHSKIDKERIRQD